MRLMISMSLLLAVSFTGTLFGQTPGEKKPTVNKSYQKWIDEAWAKAEKGEDPSTTCAAVKGAIMGRAKYGPNPGKTAEEAESALEACYVDIPARYFRVALEKVKNCETDWPQYYSGRTRALAGMMTTPDEIEKLAQRESREARLQAVLRKWEAAACPEKAEFSHGMEDAMKKER